MPSRSTVSLATGVLAGVGASLCCVAPLLLVMAGLGGAWLAHLRALEPFRPWLALIAVGALVLAHRQMFRPSGACEPGAACANPAVVRRRRRLFWITAILVLVLLASPYYINYLV